jgi:tight adherence protein B
MRIGLLLPCLLLAAAIVGWVVLAVTSRRRAALERRIDTMVSARPSAPVTDLSSSIRVRRQQSPRLERVGRLLSFPVGLPLAHVVPPVVMFAAGTGLAGGSVWLLHLLASWPVTIAAAVLLWFVMVRSLFAWELGRYQARLLRQLPDTIQLIVSATRAGLPVTESFRAISEEMQSPTREEFLQVSREMALGSTPDEALLSLHKRTKVTEYAILAVTIGVQARSGGRLAETIQNLAETIRDRLAITARAKALAGEAKVSAIIMCILPVLAGLLLSVVNPKHMGVLFHDPRGLHMFSIGVVMLLLGIVTMRQMIRGASKD